MKYGLTETELKFILDQVVQPLSLISQIAIKIEESEFPYKVDLVSDSELADSYRTSVNADKIELL